MIVVDTSALIAILDDEEDASLYAGAIAGDDEPLLSTASLVEAGIVMLNRRGARGMRKLKSLLEEGGIQVEAVSAEHAQLALEAYEMFGKGRKNAAGLNFGGCFSYALAKATGLPLLFKGQDFARTDIPPAL